MMTDKERFLACMRYQPVDRSPYYTWGGWPETLDRWRNEGFQGDESDLIMGADLTETYATLFFPTPAFECIVIEEDDTHILHIKGDGVLVREMKNNPLSSMPQFVRFPVETREDFRKFWKKRMQPDMVQRLGPDWKKCLREMRAQPRPFVIWSANWGGFFGPLRWMVGVEKLCMLFYDDPDFVEEMMDANADFIIAIMSQVLDVVSIDAFQFWEDMAYNAGPLISPAAARKYMLSRYKRVNDYLRGRGVEFIGLDSDGQIDSLIPVWMDSGINYLFPFEVQCGMDVLEVRRKYGKELRILGGIDKRALKYGPEAIDLELARVRPLILEGGYIPHTDHSVPPDVSFANYCYFMKRLGEVCRFA